MAACSLAARVVPESKDRTRAGRPDLLGAGLLALAVGLVALALVKAPSWGWGSASFLGLLAAALARGAAMVSARGGTTAPVIELDLFRSRTFSGAFAASILYYAGFGAFVLSTVEFLTGVWHYSGGGGRAGHRAGAADGAAVRPAGRAAADRPCSAGPAGSR